MSRKTRQTASLGSEPDDVTKLIEGKMSELEKSIDKRLEGLIKGIVSGLEEKMSKEISAKLKESPSNVPASAACVSSKSRGIFPTLASVSGKKDKEKLASLVDRCVSRGCDAVVPHFRDSPPHFSVRCRPLTGLLGCASWIGIAKPSPC